MTRLVILLTLGSTLLVAPRVAGEPGTEYWAVLTEHWGSLYDLTIVVGNSSAGGPAAVTIETEAGVVASGSVSLGIREFYLGPDRKASGSVLGKLAYRVRSTQPVSAYQLVAIDSGSMSGAVLVDAALMGTEYIVMTLPGDRPVDRPSIVTVVAPGAARVEVIPAQDTLAGGGVPALTGGVPATFDLTAFDVLQIASLSEGDLTGTVVRSDAPVEVFGGCIDCIIPFSAAEVVQDVMLPVPLWGTLYPAVSSSAITEDTNRWRVLASEDGTTVTTTPPQPGTPVVLDRAEHVEFASTSDFEVAATKPVLVARYTAGGGSFDNTDPSMCLMLPPERFARGVVFFGLSDATSLYAHWVDIVAPEGATVVVDGSTVPAPAFIPFGSGTYLHAQVRLTTSTREHYLETDRPIAAYVGTAIGAAAASFPMAIGLPQNLAPACDAGGPYTVVCEGPTTEVAVSGLGSSDPEGQPLRFSWSSSSPAVSFDDSSRAEPRVAVTGLGSFPLELTVTDGLRTASCATTVTTTGDAAVPPELSGSGPPLWMVRRGAELLFSWEDLGGAPMRYNVYEGELKRFYSHVPLACAQDGSAAAGGRREAVLAPGRPSAYHVMTASSCVAEGPSGSDAGLNVCPP